MTDSRRVHVSHRHDGTLFSTPSAAWAAAHLEELLRARGCSATDPAEAGIRIGWDEDAAIAADGFDIRMDTDGGTTLLTVAAGDARGLMYGLLELADRVLYADDPAAALDSVSPTQARPANPVRSITRVFTSEAEDKPWFYDMTFWEEYLTELASQRFNRFTLSVGAGYDYLIDRLVLDPYFCFFYPFVVDVPGWAVTVDRLPAEERARNLETLRAIGARCRERGLTFRLGLWNHAYDYGPDNTSPRYAVSGLSPETHAAYCRDALVELLKQVPDIEGLTFRVHFEGGVPEPTHTFWRQVLSRIGEAGRVIDLDFHAKGVTEELREVAASTGMPMTLSTKFWAEHLGPGYHPASIRDREFYGGRKDRSASSTGHHILDTKGTEITQKRSFTRYSYGDIIRTDRPWRIVHRVWPGTQRVLLWGDPAMAAGLGRAAGFCGSDGMEWFEPMSFKGKKGSGRPGGRDVRRPEALRLGTREWTHFRYTYRLWGRFAYDPDADPAEAGRLLAHEFGPAAGAVENALAHASRVTPFLLLIHAPSTACNVYWPEMYTNIPLVRDDTPAVNPYEWQGWSANADFDMDPPWTFTNTSPLDPVRVCRINEYVTEQRSGSPSGRLTPVEAAERLDRMAEQTESGLAQARQMVPDADAPAFLRVAADLDVLAGVARFFAEKLRAAIAYAWYEQTGDAGYLAPCLEHYRAARQYWADMADRAADIFVSDITFGHVPYARGHWQDRVAAIDRDIAAVAALLPDGIASREPARAVPDRSVTLHHTPPDPVAAGDGLTLRLELVCPADTEVTGVRVWYRTTDQSRDYTQQDLRHDGQGQYVGTLPADVTAQPFGIMYFFEVRTGDGPVRLLPEIPETLDRAPYFTVVPRDDG